MPPKTRQSGAASHPTDSSLRGLEKENKEKHADDGKGKKVHKPIPHDLAWAVWYALLFGGAIGLMDHSTTVYNAYIVAVLALIRFLPDDNLSAWPYGISYIIP